MGTISIFMIKKISHENNYFNFGTDIFAPNLHLL